nr:F-box domain, leucine-rich repeat domain, L domain-like protein [Tanacetum cinerariifolium]
MESSDWTEINAGIQQQLQKAYNTNKAAFKAQHWVIDPTTGTYNVKKIRRERPENITASEWDKLEAMGTYTDDEINGLAREGKQRGHIAGVGRVLPARATASPSMHTHDSTLNSLHKKRSDGCGDEKEGADHQDDEDEDDDGDA